MKDRNVIISIILIASMLAMVSVPAVKAWEYWDTKVSAPKTDNLVDYSGPHADRIQIRFFGDESSEFSAMEAGQLDLTDWPVDAAHYADWTSEPLQSQIAVVDTGAEFGLFDLDIRMDNRTFLAPGVPNPAMTMPWGNPTADVWLRRAIATTVDHKLEIDYVSGFTTPLLGGPCYTPLSAAYGAWVHPDLVPTGTLQAYTYAKSDGSNYIELGNKMLDDHGYSTIVGGKRTRSGTAVKIIFWYRSDHLPRMQLALNVMAPLLESAPPNGLGLTVEWHTGTSGAAKAHYMDAKEGHLYTGGWGMTLDPDQLYYLWHINNYYHPGRPNNYAYYPGDGNEYTESSDFQYDGRGYGADMTPYASYFPAHGAPALNFADTGKTWAADTMAWENPQNYWSWK